MSALCLLSASCLRIGSAEEEIWIERGSLPWSCSASMLVIFPFLTVTFTCAAPYWVSTASTVAVPEALEARPGGLEPLDDEPLDVVCVAVVAEAVAVCVAA